MNSSQNSETTPLSVQHDTETFTKYDLTFSMKIVTETRPRWEKVYRDADKNVLSNEQLKALAEDANGSSEKLQIEVEWEKTDEMIESKYLESAQVYDPELDRTLHIFLFATSDGPVMAMTDTRFADTEGAYKLTDPCVVNYDGKGRLNLLPIFNVARTLKLEASAIRNVQVPGEILVALYPGFILQNRMMQYQLRPVVPFVTSPEMGNSADE